MCKTHNLPSQWLSLGMSNWDKYHDVIIMKFGPAEDLCWSKVWQCTYCNSTTHYERLCRKMVLMSDWKNHNRPQHTRKLGSVKKRHTTWHIICLRLDWKQWLYCTSTVQYWTVQSSSLLYSYCTVTHCSADWNKYGVTSLTKRKR